MSAPVQPPIVLDVQGGAVVRVDLELCDCQAVGLSLCIVARGDMPAAAREIYERVGRQMLAAARTEQFTQVAAGVLQPPVPIGGGS